MTEYSSAQEIADEMDDAGFACKSGWSTAEPLSEFGVSSEVDCDWRHPVDGSVLEEDRINAIVFDTDKDRLMMVLQGIFFGCRALSPLPTSITYVHGEEWVVLSGWATNGPDALEGLAAALGGEANSADCSTVSEFVRSFDDESAFEALAVADLQRALGE